MPIDEEKVEFLGNNYQIFWDLLNANGYVELLADLEGLYTDD